MGLEFFRRSVELVDRYLHPGAARRLHDPDERHQAGREVGGVFKDREFLVGLSIDGPREIHAANQDRGREVYLFLRDECGARFMQFIPIIERVAEAVNRAPAEVTDEYTAADASRGRNEPCTCGNGRKWKHCHGIAGPSARWGC